MNTENWRIKTLGNEDDSFFFIQTDVKDAEMNGHYPKVDVMQEDFGEHNGYTRDIRMEDAKLIVLAPKMKKAITEILEVLDGDGVPNIQWVKNRLLESIKQ